MDELPAGHAFRAEFSFIDRTPLPGGDADYFAIADNEVQATSHATIRACRGHIVQGLWLGIAHSDLPEILILGIWMRYCTIE